MLIDCGIGFPDLSKWGVGIMMPDFTYLKEHADELCAIILTHGHEDHIGALPFLLKDWPGKIPPIYGTPFTLALLRARLKDLAVKGGSLFEIKSGECVLSDPFRFEFIRVNHSIVDGIALAIYTPVGLLIHTGDFKVDHSPIDGEVIDLERFSAYGDEGVHVLLSDSTNVERKGHSLSEGKVGDGLSSFFEKAKGRIIVSCFASHIHRIQQIINVAKHFGRKIVLDGQTMTQNVKLAAQLNYLHIPTGVLANPVETRGFAPEKLCILATGSQGESYSSLSRLAWGSHQQLKIEPGDQVLLSSRVIPGHEIAINSMVNQFYKQGADVVYDVDSEIHASGHAYREELEYMLKLTRPRFFVPVHGEYRHLYLHRELACREGVAEDRAILAVNGDVIEVNKTNIQIVGQVISGRIYLEEGSRDGIGESILKERHKLGFAGLVVAVIERDEATGKFGLKEIITSGIALTHNSLLENAKDCLNGELIKWLETSGTISRLQDEIRRSLRRYFNRTIHRKPYIIPIILDK